MGIDASRSTRAAPTGVEQYSTFIISTLLPKVKTFDVRLYTPQWIKGFPRKLQRRLRFPRLWTVIRLSLEMLLHKPDVLFVPAHIFPYFTPKNSYITVHDVAFEKYPMAYGAFQSFYLEWTTRRALWQAKKVIVPTESVKADLMKYYSADPEKIQVVPHGEVKLPTVKSTDIRKTLKHYGLYPDEPLFFFIGRLETKKNLMVLLDAWAIVQKIYPKGRLFLGGMSGHGFNDLFHRMESDDLQGTVLAPGYIPDTEAASIFRAATALVFPSREEGFGLPILQAFASGCNVICSDIPPLREVAAGGALYAETGSAKSFAEQMLRLIKDHALQARLKKEGKNQLKKFSWEGAARRLASEFRKS